MKSTLYSSVRSPHCLKVAIFLDEKGIAFKRVEIDLTAKQQKTPAYLRINPYGLVPAYVDDYGPHPDSLAIMHYLEWRYPSPRLFPADDALPTALQWIERSGAAYRDVSHHLYWQLIEPPANGTDHDRVADLIAQGHRLLVELEALLDGQRYLFDTFGVVDIAFIPWVYGYRRFDGLLDRARFPQVDAWVERVSARASFQRNYDQVGIPFGEPSQH